MRAIFLLLLAANIGYLFWHLAGVQPGRMATRTERAEAPDAVGVRRLVLLDELAERPVPPAASAPEASGAPSVQGAVPQPVTGGEGQGPQGTDALAFATGTGGASLVSAPGPGGRARSSEPTEPQGNAPSTPQSEGDRQGSGPDEPAPPSSIAVHAGEPERLATAGSGDTGSPRQDAEPASSSEEPGAGAAEQGFADGPPDTDCFTFGPLKSRAVATRLLVVLRNRAVEAELRQEALPEADQYWVYFPPFESREAADAAARALRAKGFTDYFVVTRGELKNALALGLFNHTAGARRRVEELRALGFEARIAPRGLAEPARYWIDYRVPPDSPLRPELLQALLGEGTAVKAVPTDCGNRAGPGS